MKNYKIAVAGTGYVGLSLGVLLSQHHQVVAVDIVQAKVDMINNKKSPIQDDYIEKYLAEKDLNLTATLDAKAASTSTGNLVYDIYKTNVEAGNQCIIAYGRQDTKDCLDAYQISNKIDYTSHAIWTRITDLNGLGSRYVTKKFLKFVDEYKPDVIHLHPVQTIFNDGCKERAWNRCVRKRKNVRVRY